jgi:hypothetical protein
MKGKGKKPLFGERLTQEMQEFQPRFVDLAPALPLGKWIRRKKAEISEFVESNDPDYTKGMDAATVVQAAAKLLSTVYPADDVGKALEDLAAKAARETTSRSATATPRLKWEADRLADENPAHFAARAGYEHRGMIHDEDRALSVKLSNWLRTHDWPEGVRYIPTKPEWNDRLIETLPQLRDNDAVREVHRVAVAASRRRSKHDAAP